MVFLAMRGGVKDPGSETEGGPGGPGIAGLKDVRQEKEGRN